jgi:hypothetical protein
MISEEILVKSVACKLVLKYLYADHKTHVDNLQHYLVPGYCQYAFMDSWFMNDTNASLETMAWADAFPETKFLRTHENRALYSILSDFIRDENFYSERNEFLRRIYKRSVPSLDKMIYIPYRLPVEYEKFEQLHER